MKKLYFLAVSILLTQTITNGAHLSGNVLLTTKLTGDQEVPAVATEAVGLASFALNETMDTLCVNFTGINLSGPITGIHIHHGEKGTNGPVLTNLTSQLRGNRVIATLTGTDLTPEILKSYLSGELYLNVHTDQNPDGEIRGQIELETDFSYHAALSGDQEVPAVITDAFGLGTFALSKAGHNMNVEVVVNGLSGPITGAHLHRGATGANGGVIVDLTSFINDNRISGSIDPAPIMGALDSGNIYINIHTSANPNGEIRGQLKIKRKILYFDAVLDTAQEDVPVTAAGNPTGVAWFNLSAGLDTLEYDIVVEDVTDTATGAHLHTGPLEGSGPVVIDLSASIDGNHIKGTYSGANLDAEFIHELLTGGVYVNVHTTANPNGEVRGQVYRLAREGYTARLDGTQEIPEVSTMASGSGMVSIDRDQSNAHFMVVADRLSGVVNGVHFHVGAKGSNGPVIYDLTPYFSGGGTSDGAFGYWTQDDPNTPFVTQNSVQFRGDSIYYNIHTASNPDGELRGQVLRGAECFMNDISVGEELQIGDLRLYPNPLNGAELKIEFARYSKKAFVTIRDLNGKVLFEDDKYLSGNTITINTQLKTGVYLVSVRNDLGEKTLKLMVK